MDLCIDTGLTAQIRRQRITLPHWCAVQGYRKYARWKGFQTEYKVLSVRWVSDAKCKMNGDLKVKWHTHRAGLRSGRAASQLGRECLPLMRASLE